MSDQSITWATGASDTSKESSRARVNEPIGGRGLASYASLLAETTRKYGRMGRMKRERRFDHMPLEVNFAA